MQFNELKTIIKRLYKDYIKFHLKIIFLCLFLSIIVATSSSATAWLLDPAVKKIFIDKDQTLAWLIPLAIIVAFASKGLSSEMELKYFVCPLIVMNGSID